MVGWVLEKEAGCKGCHCCVCEKSCPSGDEGGGSCMAQRGRSVPSFGSGEAGDEPFAARFCKPFKNQATTREVIPLGNPQPV